MNDIYKGKNFDEIIEMRNGGTKMDRYNKVYEDVANARFAWIFDENGNLKDNICCVNTLDIIEDVDWICDDDEIAALDEHFEDCEWFDGDNTYNYNANVTHGFDVKFTMYNGEVVAQVRFHLGGDIRANYSKPLYYNCGYNGYANPRDAEINFWTSFDNAECAASKEFTYDGYTFSFEPKATTEDIMVYNYETNATFEIYEFEITEDVLKDCVRRTKKYYEN